MRRPQRFIRAIRENACLCPPLHIHVRTARKESRKLTLRISAGVHTQGVCRSVVVGRIAASLRLGGRLSYKGKHCPRHITRPVARGDFAPSVRRFGCIRVVGANLPAAQPPSSPDKCSLREKTASGRSPSECAEAETPSLPLIHSSFFEKFQKTFVS
jgi:hypothetical protein